jgi:3-deoxy-7-phosphoheptulonate synthase
VEALEYLSEARAITGLPFMAEVVDPRDIEVISGSADMLRIGTRNMSNYALLKEVGQQQKPVVLKRGRTSTIEEWLDAAEYIYDQGNHDIVLVERGIRTFESSTRNTLDISAVPIAKAISHLPVMVDPSHAAGRKDLVAPLSRAAIAVGADGVLVDVHPRPDLALVDGDQALLPTEFASLMEELSDLARAMDVEI